MSIISTLLPHPLHLRTAWLEVPKILLPQPRLLIHLYAVAGEGRGGRLVRGQGREDAFCGLPRAAVGRGEEVQGVIWLEEGPQTAAGFVGLVPAVGGELHSVVWEGLVDIAVFCVFVKS